MGYEPRASSGGGNATVPNNGAPFSSPQAFVDGFSASIPSIIALNAGTNNATDNLWDISSPDFGSQSILPMGGILFCPPNITYLSRTAFAATLPNLQLQLGTLVSVNYIYIESSGLTAFPAVTPANFPALTSLSLGDNSLTSIRANGFVGGVAYNIFDVSDNLMNAAALNQLYTDIGASIGKSSTLTVTGNPGAGTSTPAIATAKGWTVIT
jgi:hypothetical protein